MPDPALFKLWLLRLPENRLAVIGVPGIGGREGGGGCASFVTSLGGGGKSFDVTVTFGGVGRGWDVGCPGPL